jgi:hypothetical protein
MKLALLVATLIIAAAVPALAQAKECRKSYYEGSNSAVLTGRYIDAAKDNAVLSWGARVTISVGPAYANWAHALNKSFRCIKQNGRHKCTARARPCTE